MIYLPTLLQKIDNFYRHASLFAKAEEDYFEELTNIAHRVEDPGLARQLQILAELYRSALSMGGGYATIARAISNLKEMYSDGDETDIEDILNGMLKTLAREAGGVNALAGRDNPRFIERLMQLKSDIESQSRDSETFETYQEEVGEGSESEKELGEAGLDVPEPIAPAALGFGSKDDPKVNRGWHTTGPSKLHKNWKEHFNNEINSYNIALTQTQDPEVINALKELIALVPQISQKVEEGTALSDQLKLVPDEEGSNKLASIREVIKNLKDKATKLRNKIRNTQLSSEQNKLYSQLNEANRSNNWKEKELLEQKLALNKLSLSTDLYKTKERNLRLRLIENMSGGNFPGADTLEKEKAKIEMAAKEKVTRAAHDRKITEERGVEQARQVTPSYEATRGGRRITMENLPPEKQINLEKASFSALVYQFQIDIASATQAARQAIYENMESGKKRVVPEYKKIIDEVSEAIRKKDRQTLYAAQTKLIAAVNGDMSVQKNQLKGFVDVIQLEPHFRKVLEGIKEVTKNKKNEIPKLDESGNLITTNFIGQDKKSWEYILNDIYRLRKLYTKYYMNISNMPNSSEWWKIKRQINPRFKRVIEDMGRIETHIALNLQTHRPENKQLYPEKSPFLPEIKRQQDEREKLKNSSINHRMMIFRLSQESLPEQEVDEVTADRLANEFFDKIYDEAYQKMFNELRV